MITLFQLILKAFLQKTYTDSSGKNSKNRIDDTRQCSLKHIKTLFHIKLGKCFFCFNKYLANYQIIYLHSLCYLMSYK